VCKDKTKGIDSNIYLPYLAEHTTSKNS